jgi:hypothetical protein
MEIKRLLIPAGVCFLADAHGLKLWQHYGQAPDVISLFVSFCPWSRGCRVVDGGFFIQGNGPAQGQRSPFLVIQIVETVPQRQ